MNRFQSFSKLEYHQNLNPMIWSSLDVLKPDIREHLLDIAKAWLEHAKISQDAVLDYTLTGGNCGFNYTAASDLDVHITVDPTRLPISDPEVMHDYIMDKKNTWAAKHNITVKSYPVELYAQLPSEISPKGQGVYSLLRNEWISKPEHLNIDYSDLSLHRQVFKLKRQVDAALENNDLDKAKALKDRITKMRAEGLARGGEFDNLPTAFKAMRNSGYLEKLSSFVTKTEDAKLSLEHYEGTKMHNIRNLVEAVMQKHNYTTELGRTGTKNSEADEAYAWIKANHPDVHKFITVDAPMPIDPVKTKQVLQMGYKNQLMAQFKSQINSETLKYYPGYPRQSLKESMLVKIKSKLKAAGLID